jgi:hypothetical protein
MWTARAFVLAGAIGAVLAPPAGAAPLESLLTFDAMSRHRAGERFAIPDVVLPAGRGKVDLEVERFEVLAPGATLRVNAGAAARPLAAPEVVLLRGHVAGDAESHVFLGVSRFGAHGYVEHAGTTIVSTGAFRAGAAPRPPRFTDLADFARSSFTCSTPAAPAAHVAAPAALGEPPCRIARVAVETDWDYALLFGGNPEAAAAYAITLLAADSEVYRRDFNVRLLVSFVRVYDGPDDPWVTGGVETRLFEFRSYWNQHEQGVERDAAIMITAAFNGGIAFTGELCVPQNAYGVAAGIDGFFPYPIEDFMVTNWDVIVTAHELGHTFGSPHTHDFVPPLDLCGLGDCSHAVGGTIMSYCHGCPPGGVANLVVRFHAGCIAHVLNDLEGAPCDLVAEGTVALDDRAQAFVGVPALLDVLQNDETASCDDAVIETFDAVASGGGTVERVPAGEDFPRDRLRFTAAAAPQETFAYALAGGASATVDVDVRPFRAPDAPRATLPGVRARYYEVVDAIVLPDFDALTPYAEDAVASVNFPPGAGPFATSRRADDVGAVFDGFVEAPMDGVYTFFVLSNEGSKLFVGDDAVVWNDGLHFYTERSGAIALRAGKHRVRIEFFEDEGTAGLQADWEGPPFPRIPILPSMWSRIDPCAADLDGSDGVGFADLVRLLARWGSCAGCPEDLDGDGAITDLDLVFLLDGWGACR